MDLLRFDQAKCNLCRICIEKCPFRALQMGESKIEVNEACRMCSVCVKSCPKGAISFEQKAGKVNKKEWNHILVYAQQEKGDIHPVVYELIGEAHRLAKKVDYEVHAVLVGSEGTKENAGKLLSYGVHKVYVYEHSNFTGFKADNYADALADCIAMIKPSVVLIGATPDGRSLAPRLSTRFHTGLTADCTKLEMRENTDLVQIRPAFGGNVMAQILVTDSRPQFATVRYKVMETAKKVDNPDGEIIICNVTDALAHSSITITSMEMMQEKKQIEDEDIIVVAGRGVKDEKGLEMLQQLADALGGCLCYTRPLVENGIGDVSHQIGLSGRTVKPRLIITAGVSGAIQFTACMKNADCIVAINADPKAQIFQIAHYCIQDNLYDVVPPLTERILAGKGAF